MFLKSSEECTQLGEGCTITIEFFNEVYEEVEVENIVQVIVGNAFNYVVAGKLLDDKQITIFWTRCGYLSTLPIPIFWTSCVCLYLILEDIGKLDWAEKFVYCAKCIIKYIYNHTCLLNLGGRGGEHTGQGAY